MTAQALLDPDRFFAPDPGQRRVARELYDAISDLPIVCPHGHVDPRLLADENATFGTPADLFIIPDHYIYRMLYSQGVPLEALGVPGTGGYKAAQDTRAIWRLFAQHWYLFRGTPTQIWLIHTLEDVFGVGERLTPESADRIYDRISDCLAR